MFKRIGLFLITNVLIMVTISIVVSVFGLWPRLTESGYHMPSLMAFCLVWGMGGSFISLLMSRWMAKMFMKVKVIERGSGGTEDWLIDTVYDLSRKAGLNKMPEVGIYQSPEVNAFATGPGRNSSLVAVSTGLLNSMNKEEITGVLGHEVAHIANGDMVTMTLIQGVINAFVMFFARIVAYAVSQSVRGESRYMVQFLVTIVMQIVFGILGSMVTAWFSRVREYRADAGSAELTSPGTMVASLAALQRQFGGQHDEEEHASFQTLKISGRTSGIMAFFSTHPPLEDRINRLKGQS